MATALTTPAPRIVPWTPKQEASRAAATAARKLPATWDTLGSIRLFRTVSPVLGSWTTSGLPRITGPCLPFPHLADLRYERGTYGRNRQFPFPAIP
ncbi:hypothetical protein GCM10020295_20640 [Streptomyces cinereospinus]